MLLLFIGLDWIKVLADDQGSWYSTNTCCILRPAQYLAKWLIPQCTAAISAYYFAGVHFYSRSVNVLFNTFQMSVWTAFISGSTCIWTGREWMTDKRLWPMVFSANYLACQ